jgi:hypothetical protein
LWFTRTYWKSGRIPINFSTDLMNRNEQPLMSHKLRNQTKALFAFVSHFLLSYPFSHSITIRDNKSNLLAGPCFASIVSSSTPGRLRSPQRWPLDTSHLVLLLPPPRLLDRQKLQKKMCRALICPLYVSISLIVSTAEAHHCPILYYVPRP